MPRNILTSFQGNLMGLGHKGELILNNPTSGIQIARGQFGKKITSAQVLALNATPIALGLGIGSDEIAMVERWGVYKPAGTAYAGIAAGEDLVLKYTNGSGAVAATPIETTGFLDQATAQVRWANGAATGDGATPTTGVLGSVAGADLVIQLLTGEITTGTSDLHVIAMLSIVPASFLFA